MKMRLFSLTRALVARKRKIFALFFALAASIGMSLNAANVVTITQDDFPTSGSSFTKDGVTVSAGTMDGISGYLTGGGSFSTTLGNFTQIEVNAMNIGSLGEGWSGNSTKKTWTGNASSVSFSGDIYGYGELTLKFTIGDAAPAKLPGAFTVNSGGDQVYFSKGNLQATTTDLGEHWSWDFAEHQWDIIGNAAANNSINGNGTVSANGTVDMFGWSTSANYYGINNSQEGTDYAGNFKDWGETIDDGWRTLTFAEWRYLLEQRAGTRYCKATVNSKTGLVIFPDNYSHPAGVTDVASANTKNADFATNSWSGDDWTNMETAGAVFLPMAGCRFGTSFMFQSTNGFYWSSTPSGDSQIYRLNFKSSDMDPASFYARYGGMFVRLVYDAPAPAGPIPCTAADLGKVLCTDGSIYATVSEATAAGKTAAAVITYIDTENAKALALALADESGDMQWATAKTTAPAHTPAVSGGTWTLASKDDWSNMITAAGGYEALRDGFSAVGGTNMNEDKYWSSTPENTNAWCYYFNYGMWVDGYVDNPCYVRACLAFDIPAAPAYETVMNLINEIPNPAVLTAECKAKIDAARTAYDALSTADKDLVTNSATLTQAETDYAALAAAAAAPVIAQIEALPTTIKLSTYFSTYDLMVAARAAYNALSAEAQAAVTNLSKLTNLEAAFAAIGGANEKLSKPFSVGEGQVVYFSHGNLQATYNGTNWSWAFAAHQYDYIGDASGNIIINGNGTLSGAGTVDLFGWVANSSTVLTSGVAKYGVSNSTNVGDYGLGTTETLKGDWGVAANDANIGGYNDWRILSKDEWVYLFKTRTDAASKYGYATVGGVNGVIIIPDAFTDPMKNKGNLAFRPQNVDKGYSTNVYTTGGDWEAMEAAGAVFMPAAGRRYGTTMTVNEGTGFYWSSTPMSYQASYFMGFMGSNVVPDNDRYRSHGLSVRLVSNNAPVASTPLDSALVVKDMIEAIPAEITLEDACVKAINDAREAYNKLSDAAKGLLDEATIAKLTDAEADLTALNQVEADKVVAKINEIPSPMTAENTKLSVYQKVQDARAAYDALTADQQALVSNYSRLTDAEAAFAAIPPVGSETVITWDKNTGIEKISGTTTSPAYEGITISIKGGGFGPQDEMLRFNIAGLGLSFEFANTLGGNFQKIVISSTNAMPSTPLAGMGEGWAASSGNKIATWTGDAATVKIWDGLTATSYWDVNTIQFTLGATVSATEAAQAAKDLIDAIGEVSYPDSKEAIKAAREAVDALGANASLLDDADLQKLTQAEAAYAELLAQAVKAVKDQIDALPATPLTDATKKLSEYNKVTDARAAYDALSDEEKAAVTNYDKLTAAEEAFAAIGGGGSSSTGALPGKFTINEGGDQISFAKGNLQATTADLGANWTWGFAANQWNYLGIAVANSKINGNGTVSENGTVDLFGWSTAATYYGINNSYKAVDYIGDFVDWGPNMGAGWRTLTKDEWAYLLQHSSNGKATVNDKNGYIFLPDNWSGPAFTANPDNFTTNVYSGDDWTAMENAGAVFLPSGPARNGTYALIANDAKYCSSTSLNNDSSYVFTIYYNQSQSACTGTNRAYGCMVRLVSEGGASPLADAQAAKDLIDAIPQPVVLSDECNAAIKDAREAVTALGENASLLDDADIAKLAKAEADFALLIKDAQAVMDLIDAIGDVTFSPECKEKIVDARNAYEELADELKPYVTNLATLTAAEEAYEAARPYATITTVPEAIENLYYNGLPQTLITAGAAEHGTMLYSLNGTDYSAQLPAAVLASAYTVYYKVQATDDYKDVAPATLPAAINYNYPTTFSLFGIPEGWRVKVNGTEATVVNGAIKNIAEDDKFDVLPTKPEDVKLVEVVPYILDLSNVTDSVIYVMNGDSITGTATGNITLIILPDAKVYFKDVNLTNTGEHPAVLCGGNAEIVLAGKNTISCTTEGMFGIQAAGVGTTLTLSGNKAQLTATIDPNGGTVNQ